MITEDKILNSLKHIIDPDLNKDIVSLGFIKNIKIEKGAVSFDIALTTPACPVKSEFQKKAEESVRKIAGVKTVKVNMTTLPKDKIRETAQPSQPLPDVRSIIAVSSCKGGVGKSTVAAYMAQELARRGYKTGLIDCDIYGPSIPSLFELQNADVYANKDKKFIPVEVNGLKLMSFGFLLKHNAAIMRGPIVTRYIQQMLLNTDWGRLDYLFLDMPPGTGDVHLTITQTLRLDGAVIVTTPHTLSLIDVARGILMFEKVSVPILGVIENLSYFSSPESGRKHYIFGNKGSRSLTERFGVDILQEIPVLEQFSQSIVKPVANEYIMEAVDKTVRALGKSNVQRKNIPNIYCDEEKITLKWNDGRTQVVSNFDLRLNSMDALSVNELTGKRKLKPEDIRKDIAAKKVMPLGNYAINIEWNDGHTAGIYPYTLIDKLAKTEKETVRQ